MKITRGVAQLGSARRSGRRGRRFKSGYPDKWKNQSQANGLKISNFEAVLFLAFSEEVNFAIACITLF